MFTWLIPLLYVQLQSFVLDIPRLFNEFLNFVSTIPAAFPDLVNSDQISVFFQAVSSELSSITQNIVKSSISGIQSTITVLLYIILFPILVYFFLFDRKNIIEGCLRIIPGDRAMLSQVWSEMDVQLSNYVRGKVLEIFIVGIAAAILFASFGLNYGALLAVLVGTISVNSLCWSVLNYNPYSNYRAFAVWFGDAILLVNRPLFITSIS